jgi:hypothetical protein
VVADRINQVVVVVEAQQAQVFQLLLLKGVMEERDIRGQ